MVSHASICTLFGVLLLFSFFLGLFIFGLCYARTTFKEVPECCLAIMRDNCWQRDRRQRAGNARLRPVRKKGSSNWMLK